MGPGSEWPPVERAGSGDVEVVLAARRVLAVSAVDRALHCFVKESVADVLDGPLLPIGRRHIICALSIWKVEVPV